MITVYIGRNAFKLLEAITDCFLHFPVPWSQNESVMYCHDFLSFLHSLDISAKQVYFTFCRTSERLFLTICIVFVVDRILKSTHLIQAFYQFSTLIGLYSWFPEKEDFIFQESSKRWSGHVGKLWCIPPKSRSNTFPAHLISSQNFLWYNTIDLKMVPFEIVLYSI